MLPVAPEPTSQESRHEPQGPHPRRARLPEAGNPLLRHLDTPGPSASLAAMHGGARGRYQPLWARSLDRHRITRLSGDGAPRARTRLWLRHGAQKGQAAGHNHSLHLRPRIRDRYHRGPERHHRARQQGRHPGRSPRHRRHHGGIDRTRPSRRPRSSRPPVSSNSTSSRGARRSTCPSHPSSATTTEERAAHGFRRPTP
jgi:hypothetical protein